MKYGLDIPTVGLYADPRVLAELALVAENAGWDGFFIWDTLLASDEQDLPVINPWIALAAIAARTQRIKIGIMLTPLARRRPWQVARETVALDYLSNGRLIFAAGLGYQARDFTPFGESFDLKIRAEKLDEGLEILKGLWTGEPFSFQGKHYQIDETLFLPRPLQSPRIPIWVAGGWPRRKPLRRAARWDGIYLMTINQETGELLTPAEIQEIGAYIRTYRQGNEPFDIAVNVESIADPSRRAAMAQQYSEAGATWWIDLEPSGQSLDGYREYIRQGPPEKQSGTS